MRIISSFHDYYDSVQFHGQDKSMVYVRSPREVILKHPRRLSYRRHGGQTEKLESDEWPFPVVFNRWVWMPDALSIREFIIGFCGKIYPMLRVSAIRQLDTYALCYDVAQVDAFVEQMCTKRQVADYSRKKRWRTDSSHDEIEAFFAECQKRTNAYQHIFIENKCPIFVGQLSTHACSIMYNAALNMLEFYRIIDTYTTFQELAMYFGNIAQPNKPIPAVSDKDMIVAKGFDKHSFRKDKK